MKTNKVLINKLKRSNQILRTKKVQGNEIQWLGICGELSCGKRKQVSRLVSHYLPEKIITNQFDSFHMWLFVQKDRYRPLNTMMFGCYNSISHPHPFKKCLWRFWVFGQIWVSQLYFIFSFKGKAHALCSICTDYMYSYTQLSAQLIYKSKS